MGKSPIEKLRIFSATILSQVDDQIIRIPEGKDRSFELDSEHSPISWTSRFYVHIPDILIPNDAVDKHRVILKGERLVGIIHGYQPFGFGQY